MQHARLWGSIIKAFHLLNKFVDGPNHENFNNENFRMNQFEHKNFPIFVGTVYMYMSSAHLQAVPQT